MDACELDTNLIKFKEHTRELKKALEFRNFRGSPAHEVFCDSGTAFIMGLLKVPETAYGPGIALADNYGAPNTWFPAHQHDAVETFIVYQGEMHLYIEDDDPIELRPTGKPHYFNARKKHRAFFPVETRYIAVTVPAEQSWPDGR